MGLTKGIFLGFVLAISVSACTSLGTFLYKFYVYDYEAGILRGPKPENDLNVNVCSLTQGEYQCVVMKLDDFYKMKTDYLKRGEKIIELERNCGRSN